MMRATDRLELLLLGALWGASFLFMRIGVPEFGPLAFVFVRVGGASLLLLALLAAKGETAGLRAHWRPLLVVGVLNSAVPFLLFNVSALVLTAGLSGIFNATAPLWGALIAWWWLGDKPTRTRALGLAVGFAGVLGLAWERASFKPGLYGVSPALGTAACILATLLYGFSVNFTKKHLGGLPPLTVAAGGQTAAALVTLLPAWWAWPGTPPSLGAWAAAGAIAVASTALAFLLYYRLIAHIGPAQAIAVTYLIPAFAMLWGALVLGEAVTPSMLIGAAIVLLGTALASGMLGQRPARAAPDSNA